ncbi:MAG: TonB-dependent receptor, partial [bacterium]|nr:TonB-dependent receptor [bacterium]
MDDVGNGISVRGNSPKGILWRIDGIEVPSPNHFTREGASGGAVSMLSHQVLTTSDFYTGAFPAEFGNALSGVFDLRMRNGNNEQSHHGIQASLLGLELATEGPFTKNKKASYLFNYRYSTLAVFGKMGFNIGNSITSYQDMNYNLNFPTKKV